MDYPIPTYPIFKRIFDGRNERLGQAFANRYAPVPGSNELTDLGPTALVKYTEPDTQSHDDVINNLIMDHLLIVPATVRRIQTIFSSPVELHDLISTGVLALVDAATKYRKDSKVDFVKYAKDRIWAAVLDLFRQMNLLNCASIEMLANKVFGDPQTAKEWLLEPNLATDNRSPLSLLGTNDGFLRVQILLRRIEYGVLT